VPKTWFISTRAMVEGAPPLCADCVACCALFSLRLLLVPRTIVVCFVASASTLYIIAISTAARNLFCIIRRDIDSGKNKTGEGVTW